MNDQFFKISDDEFNKLKQLIFDKPFIFYMKEEGAEYPYFIMWVDNPEIILK